MSASIQLLEIHSKDRRRQIQDYVYECQCSIRTEGAQRVVLVVD